MAKIDFKTTEKKKEELKLAAKRENITVSYIMNRLVDDFLAGDTKIAYRKQVSRLVVNTMNCVNKLNDCKEKDDIIGNLEELLCLM